MNLAFVNVLNKDIKKIPNKIQQLFFLKRYHESSHVSVNEVNM